MRARGSRRLAERLAERAAPSDRGALSLDDLAALVYRELAADVAYDFACLAVTDPASGVVTWASKTRSLGIGDEEFAAAEYGGPDVNKFEDIARRTPPVGLLSVDTNGHPETCRRHRDFMQPRFGFTDELRAAFVSRGAVWGALGVYRGPGDPPFTTEDGDAVAEAAPVLAQAIQRSLFQLPADPDPATVDTGHGGPAVLVVDEADRATHLTPAARTALDELGGRDHGSLPANLLAVVATCRHTGAPFGTRVRTPAGQWLSLRAAPLAGDDADQPGSDAAETGRDVVVTVEPAPRAALSRLALTAHGLTAREEEVALLVLQGANTRSIAAALHLSPHTVQDHLKKVFAKVGVASRRELTAKLMLA
ncbi:helix-turn-helix transcriptional regulator [Nocardioides anomalus]|uniref:helix-turn-helix transcriptional regulator n=1 Tax=Nocardioides anomalus TaxID=2712223 RepID=UPI0022A81E48|nr:LuxR C-terminal-related transcriptional regulator [Nocardioides anomalus]